MKKELCLFLQDWMITACASCRSTLTLYHPEDHRVLLELEPTMEDWEVYDAQGRALGRVGKGLQGQIDARSFCLLQRDVEVQERFFYAWQAMTIGRGATCTVTLSDPYVSQMHCAILSEAAAHFILPLLLLAPGARSSPDISLPWDGSSSYWHSRQQSGNDPWHRRNPCARKRSSPDSNGHSPAADAA